MNTDIVFGRTLLDATSSYVKRTWPAWYSSHPKSLFFALAFSAFDVSSSLMSSA